MKICKYCNSTMIVEHETQKDKSYKFFYTCPKCRSIYEGTAKNTKAGIKIIKSRWYNSKDKKFEDIYIGY